MCSEMCIRDSSQGMDVANVGEDDGRYPPDLWHYPRYQMTIACRVNGLDAVDGPIANFRDEAANRTGCARAREQAEAKRRYRKLMRKRLEREGY